MEQPLVSIVIPTYNGERFIADALNSALAQTWTRLEILVCDDASTDRTRDVVQSISDSRVLHLFHSPNVGLTLNLNRGIRAAQGKYICWLNQDDRFLPDKVQLQVNRLEAEPSLGAIFCQKADIDEAGNPVLQSNPSQVHFRSREEALKNLFLYGVTLCAPTVMVPRRIFAEVGYFNEKLKIAFDLDMWFRILRRFPIANLDLPLFEFRHHRHNLSGNEKNESTILREAREVYRRAIADLEIADVAPGLAESCSDSFERICNFSQNFFNFGKFVWDRCPHLFRETVTLGFAEKSVRINPDFIPGYELALLALKSGFPEDPRLEQYRTLANRKNVELNLLLQKLRRLLLEQHLELGALVVRAILPFAPSDPSIFQALSETYRETGYPQFADLYDRARSQAQTH